MGLDGLLFEAAVSDIGLAILKTESASSSRRIEKLKRDAGETGTYGQRRKKCLDLQTRIRTCSRN